MDHITRDEFNNFANDVRAEQKKHSERLVVVETKMDTMPKLVAAEISKGNIKLWIAPTIVATVAIMISKYM